MGFSIGENREKFTLDEMIAAFEWSKVSTGGPVFDLEKLSWLNGLYIRELSPESLIQRIRSWRLSDEMLRRLVPLVHERIRRLDTRDVLGKELVRRRLRSAAQLLLAKPQPRTT